MPTPYTCPCAHPLHICINRLIDHNGNTLQLLIDPVNSCYTVGYFLFRSHPSDPHIPAKAFKLLVQQLHENGYTDTNNCSGGDIL